jgi:hypothetical protein
LLIDESKERVKLHLHNTKENEIDIEKEWEKNLLKSAANESLGTIKIRNRRKVFKNMGCLNKIHVTCISILFPITTN